MGKHLLAWLLALVLLPLSVLPARGEAPAAPQVDAIIAAQLARSGAETLQQWVDGELTATAGMGGEWFLLGLCRRPGAGGTPDTAAIRQALEAQLTAGSPQSAATRQKLALCLLVAGGPAPEADLLQETLGSQGIMSWIFGLHLLNHGCPGGSYTAGEAAAQLTGLQLEGGGWALMGKAADPDVTAMALQALAPHRGEPAVAAAVEAALAVLSEKQLPDGGFASMGAANPESAAQVLAALCALGIDPRTDERFRKAGHTLTDSFAAYALPQGGYSHTAGGEYSSSATSQVFLGLVALERLQAGLPGLYQPEAEACADNAEAAQPGAAGMQGAAAASLGIIGGADGPTLLLVSGMPTWKLIAAALILLVAGIWLATVLLRGRHTWKHWLPPLLLAAVLLLALRQVDFQSAEVYYGNADLPTGEPIGSVVMEIRCDTLPPGTENVPEDGILLPETTFPIWPEDTVYDVLTRAARQHRLQLDAGGGQGMVYINGIQYLYEQAHGELSGWMFFINGESASRSCDRYTPADGDRILWAYTCEMGADLP